MNRYKKEKHLEMIQKVYCKMSDMNSKWGFFMMTFFTTLFSTMVALNKFDSNLPYLNNTVKGLLTFIALIMLLLWFAIFNYYLILDRSYRQHFKVVVDRKGTRDKNYKMHKYDMSTKKYRLYWHSKKGECGYSKKICSGEPKKRCSGAKDNIFKLTFIQYIYIIMVISMLIIFPAAIFIKTNIDIHDFANLFFPLIRLIK